MAEIEVWADWPELGQATRMGTLSARPSRGKEVFEFQYASAWLKDQVDQKLDPELGWYGGSQYSQNRPNFGVFLDSSPDRWGRVLMDRREAIAAREESRPRKTLLESDYLLGVLDGHRMGALRFKNAPGGPFLDDNQELAAPPWATLRELEHASRQLERDDAPDHPDYRKWLMMLVAPGRSLGGARPKASVVDPEGQLWIAKFPSREDGTDQGRWEHLTHILARRAGINVPEARSQAFYSDHHTFLCRRFDRAGESRLHFASAMTLLNRSDGEDASYLDLVAFLLQNGAHPDADLEQLWRRIVFFMGVSNTDDHLRNHGFLLIPGRGWALAPAYDINPVSRGRGLTLNVSEHDNSQDLGLAEEVAPQFRLKKSQVQKLLGEITTVIRGWRSLALEMGLNRREIEEMSAAFALVE